MGQDERKSRTGKGGVPIIMIQSSSSSSNCVAEHRIKPRSHLLYHVSPACPNQRVMRVKGKVRERKAKRKGRERKGKGRESYL